MPEAHYSCAGEDPEGSAEDTRTSSATPKPADIVLTNCRLASEIQIPQYPSHSLMNPSSSNFWISTSIASSRGIIR